MAVLAEELHRAEAEESISQADDRSLGFAESTPQNYLEKIFQIPFVLPGMSADGFGKLMRSLASPEPTADMSDGQTDSTAAEKQAERPTP